jgi:ComF family protein
MIAALKYRRIKVYGRVLGELLAIRVHEALADGDIETPDLLLPVPLHPLRQLARRFNQAELLTRWLAHELGIEVASHGLRRSKNTPRQTGRSRAARHRNLRGSFTAGDKLSGKRVAVIDDVMTTGTTLMSIASVLKANGVRSVQGWVVARA